MRGIVRPWGKALSMNPIDLQEDTKELEHLSTELEGLRYSNALSSHMLLAGNNRPHVISAVGLLLTRVAF